MLLFIYHLLFVKLATWIHRWVLHLPWTLNKLSVDESDHHTSVKLRIAKAGSELKDLNLSKVQ